MARDQWFHHLSAKQVKDAKQSSYKTVITKGSKGPRVQEQEAWKCYISPGPLLDTFTMQQRSIRKLQPIPAPQARERTLFLNVEV